MAKILQSKSTASPTLDSLLNKEFYVLFKGILSLPIGVTPVVRL